MAATAVAVSATPAAALDNGLARTPYLGWNTYYGLGSQFNEQTIDSVADAIVDRGLKVAGYRYVWIDGGCGPAPGTRTEISPSMRCSGRTG
jgi:alpha-galactosidase